MGGLMTDIQLWQPTVTPLKVLTDLMSVERNWTTLHVSHIKVNGHWKTKTWRSTNHNIKKAAGESYSQTFEWLKKEAPTYP